MSMSERERRLAFLVDRLGDDSGISRRDLMKRGALLGASVPAFAALLAACETDDDVDDTIVDTDDDEDPAVDPDPVDDDEDDDVDEPVDVDDEDDEVDDTDEAPDDDRRGGEIRVALIGEPPYLDLHQTSATVTTLVVMHMYETLFTWDSEFAPIPELVDTWEVSDDGLLNTLHLHQGVMFHNGQEMTAEDVYATIDRWANQVGVGFGEQLMAATEEMRIVDDYTIEFEMSEPFGTFAVVLGRQNNGCAIYPAEVVEAAGADPLTEFIGTGPYRLVEHQPDRHILMERFEDYYNFDGDPDGYGGGKPAYADTIRFIPVPDESARIAGLQTGEYDYLESVTTDHFETLEDDPNVVAEIATPAGNDQILFNMDQGISTDDDFRRAVQATLDLEEILTAAWGAGYFRLDPSHMWQETIWHTTVGEEFYNMADPELGEEILAESGYDGEPIRLLCTQEYADNYNTALMLQQQIQDIGVEVEMQVFDWATMLETRNDLAAWDIVITGFTFRADPTQLPFMRCEWGGHWCSDRKVELVDRLFRDVELDDRLDAFEQLQELMYEEIPMIKTGEGLRLLAYAPRLQNLTNIMLAPEFWNAWVDED
jgi:peptide/nickel transport system substrate-binding protein